jgi:hypothetical protein
MIALLTLLAAVSRPDYPGLAETEKLRDAPITPAQLQTLRARPLPEYICPTGDAEAFRGFDRQLVQDLLGKPDRITRPSEDEPSTGWQYYLTERRKKDKPFSHHFAEYVFWFGSDHRLQAISCFSHLDNVHIGWTHALVHPSTFR